MKELSVREGTTMDSTSNVIMSLLGTIGWLIAYVGLLLIIRTSVHPIIWIIGAATVGILLVFMIIDEVLRYNNKTNTFINVMKSIFYYASGVAVSSVGAVSLFKVSGMMINSIVLMFWDEPLSDGTLFICNIIGLVLATTVEIIMSVTIWKKRDKRVDNITLFALPIGPVAFMVLVLSLTFIISLVLMIIWVALIIVGISLLAGMFFWAAIFNRLL